MRTSRIAAESVSSRARDSASPVLRESTTLSAPASTKTLSNSRRSMSSSSTTSRLAPASLSDRGGSILVAIRRLLERHRQPAKKSAGKELALNLGIRDGALDQLRAEPDFGWRPDSRSFPLLPDKL